MVLAIPAPIETVTQVDLRQLRHHTNNALARILAQISSGLGVGDAQRRVAADLERRILLTANISDALFGLTRDPGPFDQRLQALCLGVIDLIGEPDQYVTLYCEVDGDVPLLHRETVLRIAHEFVGNAVKHGMHMRLIGRISTVVHTDAQATTLEVSDDGWGCGRLFALGEGLRVAAVLAESLDGRVSLERCQERTVARLVLPAAVHVA